MKTIFEPPIGTFRTIFLYVGQGDSTLMIIPDGNRHKYVLIDSNKDEENSDIDIATILKDKIPKGELIFINTHPHTDHLKGIEEIHETISIGEVWHSGHLPHKDNREEYDKMQKIISKIGNDNEYYLRGSADINSVHTDKEETTKVDKKIGDVDFQVFSPASYVCEEVDGLDPETRRKQIHEQCGVIKFLYKDKSILVTGDSDKEAWVEHITQYYKDYIDVDVLSASHHGSRSFFKDDKDDKNPFKKHIERISPEYLIISAPKKSKHNHPHSDAMVIYKEYITEKNIFYLGQTEKSCIVDISLEGNLNVDWLDDFDGGDDEKKATIPSIKNKFIPAVEGGPWCK